MNMGVTASLLASDEARATSDESRAVIRAPHAPETAPAKRRVVHHLFSTIAPRYDWFNRLASLNLDGWWRRRAVAIGQLRGSMRVLDVCSGTGDLALLCAKALREDGLVVGVDFTWPMLQGALRKQQAQGARVSWLEGDALSLPFAADSFDRVFIGFSTRNLTVLRDGLREMLRVVRPGGQVIILETGRPSNPIVRAGYELFLGTVVRAIGLLLTGRLWPFTYLARSVAGFLSPAEFVALLRDCGAEARYLPLSFGLASVYLATKPSL